MVCGYLEKLGWTIMLLTSDFGTAGRRGTVMPTTGGGVEGVRVYRPTTAQLCLVSLLLLIANPALRGTVTGLQRRRDWRRAIHDSNRLWSIRRADLVCT